MINRRFGALAGMRAARSGSRRLRQLQLVEQQHEQRLGDDLRRRLHVCRTGLRTVGLRPDSGLTVNYQAVGSGAGITAFAAKTVDFGASDPPLKPAEEAAIAKNGSPAATDPDVPRCDHRLLQRAGRDEPG